MYTKKITGIIITLTLVLSLFSISVFAQEQQQQEQEVVATINGEEIYMSELEQEAGLQQILMQLQQYPEFIDALTTTEAGNEFMDKFKSEYLDTLIDQKILEMEVEEQGIELSEEEKDEFFNQQLEQIKQQQNMSEEDILDALEQQGIESMDQFKEQFIEQQGDNLLINKLLEEVDVEISDEKAKEAFEEGQYQGEFEDVKDQIKNQLAQEKYIEELKEDAEIEKEL
ncbi:MAG: SurA N-terminal domain-containing protein [Bacillota bacterium]